MSTSDVIAWAREHINANADEWHTGGGCRAIGIPTDDGGHWLITADHGTDVPESIAAPLAVGLYGKDGEHWVCFNCENLPAARKLIASCAFWSL